MSGLEVNPCPCCGHEIQRDEYVAMCSWCGTILNEHCRHSNGRCTTLGCAGRPVAVVRASSVLQAGDAVEIDSPLTTDAHVVGKACPFCQSPIKPGADHVSCSECGIPHHAECWRENGGCTTFGCSRRSSDPAVHVQPTLPAVRRQQRRFPTKVVLAVRSLALVTGAAIFLLLALSWPNSYLRTVRGECSASASTDRPCARCLASESVCGQSILDACESAELAVKKAHDRLSRVDPPDNMRSLHWPVLDYLDRHAAMYMLIHRRLQSNRLNGSEIVICWDGLRSDYRWLSGDAPEQLGTLPGFSRQEAVRRADLARRLAEFRMQHDAADAWCDYADNWIRRYNDARNGLATTRKRFETDRHLRSSGACRAITQAIVRRQGLRSDLLDTVLPEHFAPVHRRLSGTIDDGISYSRLVNQWACILSVSQFRH